MGQTRALLTIRLADGSTTYVNTEKMAIFYLERVTTASVAGSPSSLKSEVVHEVEERLSAIQPIITGKVLGLNNCSSHRARRNVAEHNFQVKMQDVSLADARQLQRGRTSTLASAENAAVGKLVEAKGKGTGPARKTEQLKEFDCKKLKSTTKEGLVIDDEDEKKAVS